MVSVISSAPERRGVRMNYKVVVLMSLLSGCVPTPETICDLSTVNKSQVMDNVWAAMDKRYPWHSEYCAVNKEANQFSFYSDRGGCRVYLPCAELNENGQSLLHGDWIISFDPISSEVKDFYDVAW